MSTTPTYSQLLSQIWDLLGVNFDRPTKIEVGNALAELESHLQIISRRFSGSLHGPILTWLQHERSRQGRRTLLLNFCDKLEQAMIIINDLDEQDTHGVYKSIMERLTSIFSSATSSIATASAMTSAATSANTSFTSDATSSSRNTANTSFENSPSKINVDTVAGANRSDIRPDEAKKLKTTHVPHQITSLPEDGFGVFDKNLSFSRGRIDRTLEALLPDSVLPSQVDVFSVPAGYLKPSEDRHLVLAADIRLSQRTRGPLFVTTVSVRKLQRSNSLERQFGWHRLMYATIQICPLTTCTKDHTQAFDKAFSSWFARPKNILGRTWYAFYIEDVKQKRQQRQEQKLGRTRSMEVSFFATEGPGLIDIPIDVFWSMTMHPELNKQQPFLKFFSRWKLQLSRTLAVDACFTADHCKIMPDPTPSSRSTLDPFQDPNIHFEESQLRPFDEDESMTDGNAAMSVGAYELIREKLPHLDATVLQGRFLGSKGVWYLSAPIHTTDQKHKSVWIDVHHSQRKLLLDYNNLSDAELCFNIVAANGPPKQAELHRDFLAIMVDRHVPIAALEALARRSIECTARTWEKALTNPQELYLLLFASSSLPKSAGPLSNQDLALKLVKSGFMPDDTPYLGELLLRLCCWSLGDDLAKFSIKCPRSASMIGIAHRSADLQPNEVYFRFTGFIDEEIGEAVTTLPNGTEVLIGRDPTLRPSDMQKFISVNKPELSHLTNVLVFSSLGSMPAGAKMQGGDYDGDRYTVIWDPSLTKPFLNVPVQRMASEAELGIAKTSASLATVAGETFDESAISALCRAACEFRLKEKTLGMVTTYATSLGYHNGLWDRSTVECTDLHDYIIDADKNGYSFGADDFSAFKKARGLSDCLRPPAWKKSADALTQQMQDEHSSLPQEKRLLRFCSGASRSLESKQHHHKHVLDHLWFTVILPSTADAIGSMLAALPKPTGIDRDLLTPLATLEASVRDGASTYRTNQQYVSALSKAMRTSFYQIFVKFQEQSSRRALYDAKEHDKLRLMFEECEPPTCFQGRQTRPMSTMCSEWELVRAALLVVQHNQDQSVSGRRLFWLAQEPLCLIKAHSRVGSSRASKISKIMVPRRSRMNALAQRYGSSQHQDATQRSAGGDTEGEDDDGSDNDLGQDDPAEEFDEYGDNFFTSSALDELV